MQQRTSIGNVAVQNAISGQRIWKPIEIEGTYAVTDAQIEDIITAMENNNSDASKNLGYVTLKDNEGTNKEVYLLTVVWGYQGQITKITGIERADNYAL